VLGGPDCSAAQSSCRTRFGMLERYLVFVNIFSQSLNNVVLLTTTRCFSLDITIAIERAAALPLVRRDGSGLLSPAWGCPSSVPHGSALRQADAKAGEVGLLSPNPRHAAVEPFTPAVC
jgi:hypothetical protein